MIRYQQDRDIAWRDVDGEAVLVDPAGRMLRVLNPAGCVLWTELERPRTLDDLAAALAARYEVEPARARADAEAFVRERSARKLVQEIRD